MGDSEKTPNYDFPEDRHYDGESHLWAKANSALDRVLCGIDALGLEALGEIAYVSLQAVGVPVQRGESIGTLEAAKMTTPVIAPISGILVARNEPVMRDPQIVNEDPYEQGWLVAVEPGNWNQESAALIHGSAIPAWVDTEIDRYRDEGWID